MAPFSRRDFLGGVAGSLTASPLTENLFSSSEAPRRVWLGLNYVPRKSGGTAGKIGRPLPSSKTSPYLALSVGSSASALLRPIRRRFVVH